MTFDINDPVTEQQRYQNLYEQDLKDKQTEATIDPNVAERVKQIYKDAPYIPASVVLSLAKGGASNEAVNALKKSAVQKTTSDLDPNKPNKKGWWERNVHDKAKAVTRWTFAGLNLVPDLAQNAASQIFSDNDPAGYDGWFKSTQLGTLMANSKEAGDGYFMGQRAMETQAKRAKEFRGTINGYAWTVGRGAAEVVFTPGSKPYSLLSGFIDAAVTIGADPTLPAGKAIKSARLTKALMPGLRTAEEIDNAKLLAKGLAGLESAEGMAFKASKFGTWVTTDPRAKRLTSRIVGVASDAKKTVEEKTLFMLENIEGLDPVTARAFAEADTESKVLGLLGTASSRLTTNPADVLLPTDIRDIKMAQKFGVALDDAGKERAAFYRNIRNSRWFETMPKQQVVVRGTGADKAEAVKTYARYLRGVKLGDETPEFKSVMAKVVAGYSSDDPVTARATIKSAYEEMLRVVTRQGLDRQTADELVDELIKQSDAAKSRVFNLNDVGDVDDGGALAIIQSMLPEGALDDIPLDVRERMVISGPGALNELADDMYILPDYRRMRALAGNPFLTRKSKYRVKDLKKLRNEDGIAQGVQDIKTVAGKRIGQDAGEQRKLAIAASFLQQEIWKPLALATGGYVVRNMIDAQTRIAMSGNSGIFSHPQDFIMWVMRKKGGFDITGEDFGGITLDTINKEQKQLQQALTFDLHKNLKDPLEAEAKLVKNGSFSIVTRAGNLEAHTTGYVDNLGLIYDVDGNNVQSLIARLDLEGLDQAERVQRITDWLYSPENKETLGQFREWFNEGVRWTDPEDLRNSDYIRIPPESLDDAIPVWIDRLSEMKVGSVVKNNDDFKVVASYNRVPLTRTLDNGTVITEGTFNIDPADIDIKQVIQGNGGVGSIIKLDEGGEGVILRRVETPNGVDPFTGDPVSKFEYVVQPVHTGSAFTADGLGTANLRRLIESKPDDQVAKFVKRAERGVPNDPNSMSKFGKAKDAAVDFFFTTLYGKATQYLEKSPVFRQYYYREVFTQADLLAPQEATRLLSRAKVQADELGIKLHNYLGGKDVLARLEEVAASTSDAVGTVEQLDDFAKAIALRQTKELLYNATERSNLEDVMRIVVPFGSAWKEVLGTYTKNLIEDPTRIRKAQLIFDGGRKFDPDNDGQGFFYKDPTTGEYSFNFPFSGDITQLITGQDVSLQAPVKRISIGLGVVPSIGPMAQIAASKIIPDTPSADWITSILLPYGKKESFQVMPMWAKRAMEAWQGNTQNLQSVYGNTYIETLRALSASGEYDLADPNEQEQLYADARQKARWLTGLRALGQFLGPTSPSPEFKIDTIQGDIYATQLVKEFQKLQAANYDTAVSEFLRIYGNDALLYISNKTESVAGGLEATDDFGDWERGEGKGLIDKYSDVAGFMAPCGDDFSFEVWSRQLAKGRRRRLSDREIVELAQYRAASAKYRALRDQLPPRPSDEQKRWLRQWRVQLNKEYPGFPVVAEFNPGEFPKKLEQLNRLVSDPAMADNDVADATRQYLEARQNAIARYVEAGGAEGGFATAIATQPLRDWLAGIGRALKQETPEFARLYDRLLSNEVEE